MTELPRPAIFVIDDEQAICRVVSRALGPLGIDVLAFGSGDEAFAAMSSAHPRVILLDLSLNQCDAIDVVHGLGARQYRGVVHLMSGAREQLVDAVQRIGMREGLNFGTPLHKPFNLRELRAIGELVIETHRST